MKEEYVQGMVKNDECESFIDMAGEKGGLTWSS